MYICLILRLKAIILIFIFLLGGNGISVDISKCCDKLAGVSIGFGHEEHIAGKTCCPSFKKLNKDKVCCENVVISTVINHVPGLSKTYQSFKPAKAFLKPVKVIVPALVVNGNNIDSYIDDINDDAHYPIPILLKKRVLTI